MENAADTKDIAEHLRHKKSSNIGLTEVFRK